MLIGGNLEAIFTMLFGPDAENRMRKCSECHEIIEGSDAVYAAHYEEVHECEPAFTCEICDQVVNSASEYHNHLKEHLKQQKPPPARASRKKKAVAAKKYIDYCSLYF